VAAELVGVNINIGIKFFHRCREITVRDLWFKMNGIISTESRIFGIRRNDIYGNLMAFRKSILNLYLKE